MKVFPLSRSSGQALFSRDEDSSFTLEISECVLLLLNQHPLNTENNTEKYNFQSRYSEISTHCLFCTSNSGKPRCSGTRTHAQTVHVLRSNIGVTCNSFHCLAQHWRFAFSRPGCRRVLGVHLWILVPGSYAKLLKSGIKGDMAVRVFAKFG
jgi:hypothetical protein